MNTKSPRKRSQTRGDRGLYITHTQKAINFIIERRCMESARNKYPTRSGAPGPHVTGQATVFPRDPASEGTRAPSGPAALRAAEARAPSRRGEKASSRRGSSRTRVRAAGAPWPSARGRPRHPEAEGQAEGKKGAVGRTGPGSPCAPPGKTAPIPGASGTPQGGPEPAQQEPRERLKSQIRGFRSRENWLVPIGRRDAGLPSWGRVSPCLGQGLGAKCWGGHRFRGAGRGCGRHR